MGITSVQHFKHKVKRISCPAAGIEEAKLKHTERDTVPALLFKVQRRQTAAIPVVL